MGFSYEKGEKCALTAHTLSFTKKGREGEREGKREGERMEGRQFNEERKESWTGSYLKIGPGNFCAIYLLYHLKKASSLPEYPFAPSKTVMIIHTFQRMK